MEILILILFIALTCVIIWRSSDGFEAASEYLGRNLSEGVKGATINAIGSSMPELFATIFFLFFVKDASGSASEGFAGGIGTTAGSAIFNGVIIPASVILVVTAYGLADKIKVSRKVILRDGLSLIIAELVLILFIGSSVLYWWHGLLLMLVYAGYVTYMLTSMSKNHNPKHSELFEDDSPEEESQVTKKKNPVASLITLDLEPVVVRGPMNGLNAWILLLLSMAVIGGACFLLVDSCEKLGHALGIPLYFVAVVLAAAATSVPDTILSIRDAVKGNYDDAVSNAIGSNIFDICFALGLPLFLYTLLNEPLILSDHTMRVIPPLLLSLLALTSLAVLIFYVGNGMGKVKAALLVGIYLVFLVYIFGDKDLFGYTEGFNFELRAINESLDSLRFWIN